MSKLHITKATVDGTNGIEFVEIDINGVVQVIGRNGSGKTALLESITQTLLGEKPEITKGRDKGFVLIEGIDFKGNRMFVKRSVTSKGATKLEIKVESERAGETVFSPINSPADFLKSLIGPKTMILNAADMQAKLKPEQRVEEFTRLCGVDTEDIDDKIKAVISRRKEVNSEITFLRSRTDKNPYDPEMKPPIDIAGLQVKISDGRNYNQSVENTGGEIQHKTSTIENFQEEIAKLKLRISTLQGQTEVMIKDRTSLESKYSKMSLVDVSRLESELATASEHNERAAANQALRSDAEELEAKQTHYSDLDEKKKAFEAERIKMFDAIGVYGLSIEKDDVYLERKGEKIPVENLSFGESMRLAVQIRILQKDGVDLYVLDNFTLIDPDIQSELRKELVDNGLNVIEVHNAPPENPYEIITLKDGSVEQQPEQTELA